MKSSFILIHSVVVRRSGTSALRRARKFAAGDRHNVKRDEEGVDEVDPPAPAVLGVVATNCFDARKNIHARGDEEEAPDVGVHELEDFSCARGLFSVLLVGAQEAAEHLEVGEDHDGQSELAMERSVPVVSVDHHKGNDETRGRQAKSQNLENLVNLMRSLEFEINQLLGIFGIIQN